MSKETTGLIDAALKEYAFPLLEKRGFRKSRRRATRELDDGVVQTIWYDVVNYRATGCSTLTTRAGIGYHAVQQLLCEALGWDCDSSYPIHLWSDTGRISGVGFLRGEVKVCSADDVNGLQPKLVSDIENTAIPFCDSFKDIHVAERSLSKSRNVQDSCRAAAIMWLGGEREAAVRLAAGRLAADKAGLHSADRLDLERLISFFEVEMLGERK